MPPDPLLLRRATRADGEPVFALITGILHEFGLQPDATGTDADLKDIEAAYHAAGGDFVVLVDADARIVGCCGLFRSDTTVVELRKMYVAATLRGQGQGRRLLDWALARARELGFRRMDLETNSVLKTAIAQYVRRGFKPVDTGCHTCRCDAAYSREL